MPLKLTEADLLGEGRDCKVYHHPHLDHQCVKILKSDREGAQKRAHRETQELLRLQKKGKGLEWFSGFRGTIETVLGRGYQFDLVRDDDGKVSTSLKEVLNSDDPLPKKIIYDLLRDFYQGVLQHGFILSDMHVDNLLLQYGPDHTPVRLVIIDGMGNADFIKYCHWSKWLCQRKAVRKIKRMLRLADLDEAQVFEIR